MSRVGSAGMRVEVVDAIPPLAWLFHLGSDLRHGAAYVGSKVDVWSDGLFEGAWAGAFSDAGFDRCGTVMGSGMKSTNDGFVFVPPTHMLEGLYVVRQPAGTFVSNSLAYLISFARLEPSFRYDSGRRFASVAEGLERYERDVLFARHGPIERVCVRNVHIDPQGHVGVREKPELPQIRDFASYRSLLSRELQRTLENARDPDRRVRFAPLSTCSSGYDSAAVTVLAAELGCDEALALRTSRDGGGDAGRDVAARLGVRLHVCERLAPSSMDTAAEAEFLATGMGGEDFAYRSFESHLRDRVFLTGFRGYIWERHPPYTDDMQGGDISGTSLTEFRLRVGFVHVPVPTIGLLQGRRIASVSSSEEMRPFCIGGPYDKPIPRRILEEAGVERERFGRSKRAASVLLHDRPSLMSRAMRERAHRMERAEFGGSGHLGYRVRKVDFWIRYYAARALRKAAKVSPAGNNAFRTLAHRLIGNFATFEHNNPRSHFDLMAAVRSIQERYRDPRP